MAKAKATVEPTPTGSPGPKILEDLLNKPFADARAAKKSAKAKKVTENGDGLDIPDSLKVENRKPPTPEQQAKVDEVMKKANVSEKVVPFGKPKGMPVEEWEAQQSRDRQEREAAKAERLAKLPKKAKKAKAELPAGAFTIRDRVAKELGIAPSVARGIARQNKDKLKPIEIGLHTFAGKSFDAVVKIIKDGLEKKAAKAKSAAPQVKAVGKKKIPPPTETVWTGKAKKAKTPEPEPVVSKKAAARAEINEAMKGRKKVEVPGGAMHVKPLRRKK